MPPLFGEKHKEGVIHLMIG